MQFDVIELTEEEIEDLTIAQMKLLRKAQRSKDELIRKAEQDFEQFKQSVWTAGMKYSSLLDDKREEIDNELNYRLDILADDLIYNMSISDGGEQVVGYLVDYSLSYNDRYIIVRDYYLAIEDKNLRMKKYESDAVAKKYLGDYYNILYNILKTSK